MTVSKRILVFVLVLSMTLTMITINDVKINVAMAQTNVKVGDYVKFGKYNNKPILWRVIHIVTASDISNKSYKGYKEGDALLLSDKVITFKCFDAKDAVVNDYHGDRAEYGCNNWGISNIRTWLNSDEETMWSGSYGGNNRAPTKYGVWNGYNPYYNEKGFLSDDNFTETERDFIRNVRNRFVVHITNDTPEGNPDNPHMGGYGSPDTSVANYAEASYQSSEEKVFLLNIPEFADYVDGELYHTKARGNISVGDNYCLVLPTKEAYDNLDNKEYISPNEKCYQWLRDAYTGSGKGVRRINPSGEVDVNGRAFYGLCGVRPALYVDTKSACFTNGTGSTEDDAFEIKDDKYAPNGEFTPNSMDIPVNHDINVSFNPNDDVSGVKNWKYFIDGVSSTWSEYIEGDTTKTITLTKNGRSRIKVYVYDNKGKERLVSSGYYNIDKIKPRVSIDKNLVIEIARGTTYTNIDSLIDISASDNSDGDLTSKIKVKNNVNSNVVGTYTVEYNVTDTAGNVSEIVTRTVKVVENDSSKPTGIFTPNSKSNTNQNIDVNFNPDDEDSGVKRFRYRVSNDEGVTYKDWSEYILGDVSKSIALSLEGKNKIEVEIEDNASNVQKLVSGIYIIDKTKPVISVANNSIDIKKGSDFSDSDALNSVTALDNVDGDITNKIVVTNNVDTNVSKVYTLYYDIYDKAGNAAITKSRIVNVLSDIPKPKIVLNGSKHVIVNKGSIYKELGATAVDSNNKPIKIDDIKITGEVDVNKVGEYIIKYEVTDSTNKTVVEYRKVSVVKDYNGIIHAPGTKSSDRKYFRYYLGYNKYNILQVMLVCGKNDDGTIDRTFSSDDIINYKTNKFNKGIYYINDKGEIREYIYK